jgi:hypothetical protein
MSGLRRVYDFVTGGSVAAPIGLVCAIVAAATLPAWRAAALVLIIALALTGAVFERPT